MEWIKEVAAALIALAIYVAVALFMIVTCVWFGFWMVGPDTRDSDAGFAWGVGLLLIELAVASGTASWAIRRYGDGDAC